MEPKPVLRIRRSALEYKVRFQQPLTRLLHYESGLLDDLLRRLGKFGATMQGVSVTPAPEDLSKAQLSVPFVAAFGTVTVRLQELSVVIRGAQNADQPDVPRIMPLPDLDEVVATALEAVRAADDRLVLVAPTVTFLFHADLEGETPLDLLGRFVGPAPKSLGDASDLSVRYAFGEDGIRKGAVFILEPSRIFVPNGVFMQADIVLDEGHVDSAKIFTLCSEYAKAVTGAPDFPVVIA
jgi:hypothetical protein